MGYLWIASPGRADSGGTAVIGFTDLKWLA